MLDADHLAVRDASITRLACDERSAKRLTATLLSFFCGSETFSVLPHLNTVSSTPRAVEPRRLRNTTQHSVQRLGLMRRAAFVFCSHHPVIVITQHI
jgi:hypothetical protein